MSMPILREQFLRFGGLSWVAPSLSSLADPQRLGAAPDTDSEKSYGVHFVDATSSGNDELRRHDDGCFSAVFQHGSGAHSVDSLGAKLLGTNFLEQVTETERLVACRRKDGSQIALRPTSSRAISSAVQS